MKIVENKRYIRHNISEDSTVFNGYLEDYSIADALLVKLSKDLGFSYDLYQMLDRIDHQASKVMVNSMSKQSKHTEVIFLLNEETHEVLAYSLDSERTPLLNSEFMHRVQSLSETSKDISIAETYYDKEDIISSVIIKKNSPVVIEEKYETKDSKFIDYDIGVLIVNDEAQGTYCRLVLYVEGQPLYLPASYYNVTASRYRRSTQNSAEALELLMLKIIEDLREEALQSKIYDLHFRYRANKHIVASYEEYNNVLKAMRKIPSIILESDDSILSPISSKYEKFEEKYPHLEDQRSSYIWRCTALSDVCVGALVSDAAKILTSLNAPAIEYTVIRELLGSYISTNRIAAEIAKENII